MKIKTLKDFAIVELPKEVRSEEEKATNFIILERHKIGTFWGRLLGKYEWRGHYTEYEFGFVSKLFHESEEKAKIYINKVIAHYNAIDKKIKSL